MIDAEADIEAIKALSSIYQLMRLKYTATGRLHDGFSRLRKLPKLGAKQ